MKILDAFLEKGNGEEKLQWPVQLNEIEAAGEDLWPKAHGEFYCEVKGGAIDISELVVKSVSFRDEYQRTPHA
eukprot:6009699-Lingulodinium_polyedra.AAC.1